MSTLVKASSFELNQGETDKLVEHTVKTQLVQRVEQAVNIFFDSSYPNLGLKSALDKVISEVVNPEYIQDLLKNHKGLNGLIAATIEKAVEVKAKTTIDKIVSNAAGSVYNGAVVLTDWEKKSLSDFLNGHIGKDELPNSILVKLESDNAVTA